MGLVPPLISGTTTLTLWRAVIRHPSLHYKCLELFKNDSIRMCAQHLMNQILQGWGPSVCVYVGGRGVKEVLCGVCVYLCVGGVFFVLLCFVNSIG